MSRKRVIRAGGPPGLDGTFAGTCIACLTATDTAVAIEGEPEYHAGFLISLGIPTDQAIDTVEGSPHDPPDARGRYQAMYRVCASCAAKASSAKPGLVTAGAEIPIFRQPGSAPRAVPE